jgi:NAD(P)-dependent dehydrogenase (short-subunit alcohol dehydrogenase family)
VTGGNRGLGKALVQALLDAGARKVYVAARQPTETGDPRLQSVKLDITHDDEIASAVKVCQDITILINNAGIFNGSPLLGAPSIDDARDDINTNYLGTLAMCRAFAPILKKNGGGALVNILSVVSWFIRPQAGSYGVSKAAEWAMTNGVRIELRSQGTLVVGVHAGFIDTDMAASAEGFKASPADVAAKTIAGISAGDEEILADKRSQEVKAALAADPQSLNRQMQQAWDRS